MTKRLAMAVKRWEAARAALMQFNEEHPEGYDGTPDYDQKFDKLDREYDNAKLAILEAGRFP